MSDLDDVKEFAEASSGYQEQKSRRRPSYEDDVPCDPEAEDAVGTPVQYATYSGGYTSTSSTIQTLPAGCYDIFADSKCVFVRQAIKASGLLLELPEMRSEEVIRLVDNFWESEKDYKEGNEFVIGGAAYKAGIMIYGPPGSGKSCTIKIVSNKLIERGGIVFYSSVHPATVMSWLGDFARIENNRKCIVILEDVDSLIQQHGESLYLEMLDSAKTIDNVLFIATTNYPDRLDPRIYNRPGRFSHVIKIGLPGPATREAYLKAILKDHRDVPEIVANSDGFTIDHLTALVNAVYREKKVLSNEIKRLRTLFKMPNAGEGKGIGIGT